MAIIVVCSASGSPGVSTSAIGLALSWPRPCLLVEADPSGASAMLSGRMREVAPSGIPSVFHLAVLHRQRGSIPPLLDTAVVVPDTNLRLISGIRHHLHAASVTQVWAPIVDQLRGFDEAGTDVIVDLGRLGLTGSPQLLLQAADLVLLTTRSTLPALIPAKNWAVSLTEVLGPDSGRLGLLLIGAGHPYTAAEVTQTLQLPVVASLPNDPTSAEVFHLGTPPGRRFDRSPLAKALPAAAAAIRGQIEASRTLLQGSGRGA